MRLSLPSPTKELAVGAASRGLLLSSKRSAPGHARLPCQACNPDPADGAAFTSSSSNHHPHLQTSSSNKKPGLLQVFHRQLMRGFDDAGIGAENVVEACIGIIVMAGSLALGGRLLWKKGSQLASSPHCYRVVFEFPLASGIDIGTPVRLRGVDMGSVVQVRPSLERIDAVIQVRDSNVYIPRNAIVEVNQSGLLGETIIDVMPVQPTPHPSVGPLDPNCVAEGLIVCDKGRLKGKQGVSMDELIQLTGKMARQSKHSDLNELFTAASQLGATLDNSKHLLNKIETLVEDTEPVMKMLQDGKLLRDLEQLLKTSSRTAHELRGSRLATENGINSMATLIKMLQDLESTTADASNLLRDDKTRSNLKLLIELLSRLVNT